MHKWLWNRAPQRCNQCLPQLSNVWPRPFSVLCSFLVRARDAAAERHGSVTLNAVLSIRWLALEARAAMITLAMPAAYQDCDNKQQPVVALPMSQRSVTKRPLSQQKEALSDEEFRRAAEEAVFYDVRCEQFAFWLVRGCTIRSASVCRTFSHGWYRSEAPNEGKQHRKCAAISRGDGYGIDS